MSLLDDCTLFVSAGPGGVGKTTTAAALGVLQARRGKRVLVSTIDPAPRLVDALHMPALGAEPVRIPDHIAARLGITAPGSLSAARLDTERAYQRLVEAEVEDPERRQRIFANPIYKQITTNLTGALEHAATLAIHDLAARPEFDVFVLDTPPTSNALDFVEAPRKLAEAIDSPALRWLIGSGGRGGLLSVSRLGIGGALVMKRLAKLVGLEFLEDVAAFLVDFQTVLGGFLARSQKVDALLRGRDVGVFLVLAPERPAVDEAIGFEERLRGAGLPPRVLIANRTAPEPGVVDERALAERLRGMDALGSMPAATIEEAAAAMAAAARELAALSDAQTEELARLTARARSVPLVRVPLAAEEAGSLPALLTTVAALERQIS